MAVSNERRGWIVAVAGGGGQGDLSREQLDALTDDELDEYNERPYRDFFASVTDPEELHIFAASYPCYPHVATRGWELDLLQRVVRHPSCDLGTALLIYWRVRRWLREPSRMPEGKPVPEEMKELVAQLLAREEQIRQQTTSFLEEVERRVVGQAYRTASQRFDPRNDGGQDLIAAAVAVSESGQRSQGGGDQPPSQMDQAIGLAPEN